MLDLKFVSSLAERDIDFVVLEELEVSDEFRAWFACRVFEAPVFEKSIGAWHSVSSSEFGESDLIFIFQANDGSRKAVLIENKIDAPPQSRQGERYRLRGERGVADGTWDEFRTCIVAPERYLGSAKHSEKYDAEIGYEEILGLFVGLGFRDGRYAYRARIVQEAIEQNRRGYQPVIDETMTTFVRDYVTYAREKFPDLGVEEAKPRPAGSTWIVFYPAGKSKGVQVLHQFTAGFLKILLPGKADQLSQYVDKYADVTVPDFEVQKAGKSVGLAFTVPKLDPFSETFEGIKFDAEKALSKLDQLVDLARSHGDI